MSQVSPAAAPLRNKPEINQRLLPAAAAATTTAAPEHGRIETDALYLETSVIGACLDNGEPFRRDLTIRWWEHEMPEYRAVISSVVVRELERTPEPHRTGLAT
ncbi:MAG: hypothetical protein WKF84_08075 [Pyrinomonadaceae bacterium]